MKSNVLIVCAVIPISYTISADAQTPASPANQRATVTATVDASICPDRGTWSQRPATRWEDAMVSGNGRMGVMVFGDPLKETMVANHCRLFLPLGSREIVPDLGPFLPELRKVIGAKHDYRQGMDFMLGKAKEQGFPGIIYTDPFHPGMFVHIQQPAVGDVRGFSRSEDFATGEVRVQWADDRGRWSRRTFVSRGDNVIVTCLGGSARVNCRLLFPPLNPTVGQDGGGWIAGVRADLVKSRQTIEPGSVTYHNVYTKGKGGFDSAIRVCLEGGKATAGKDGITIQDADEVMLLMRIAPWKTPLPKDRSEAWAYSPQNPDFAEENLGRYVACPKLADSSVVAFVDTDAAEALMPQLKALLKSVPADYDVLFEKHVALHRPLFERVRLDLGAPADQRRMSSEQLLDEAGRSRKMSLALAEKIHDAGRYMFLCCAGELPPNLQGLWTGTWKPAWSGDFTLDTNLQLAMKHGYSGNCPELMEGYFRLMESFYPEWRLNAKRTYGADGFLTNARASNTALLLHWGKWPGIFWTAGCGWLVRPFHEHYLYTGDRQFLEKRTVPFLEEVAAFYEDFVVVDEATGRIKFVPSFSPETGACTSATMDVMVMRDVLTNLIAAYQTLGIKTQDIPKWQALLARLPDYRINDDGALAEWIPEGRQERYKHRHLSHLHSAYEANGELGPDADPVLRAAAREAVRRRIYSGGQQSSHGRVHMGLAAAELDLAEEAYGRIEIMATGRSMAPSLMCTHEPEGRIFNLDANGAMPEIMHRMLFRARPGSVELLPALPDTWPKGQITGVLAKGRITIVRLAWDTSARTVTCVMRSQVGQNVTVTLSAFDPQGALTRSITLMADEDTPVTLTW